MTKLIVMQGIVISDMDRFLDKYVQGDDEEADEIRAAYRYIEEHGDNYVMVDNLDQLTEEEEMELYEMMQRVGGFESKGVVH